MADDANESESSVASTASAPQTDAPRHGSPLTAPELARVADVTLRLGKMVAVAGAAAFRVRETMRRAATSFGVGRVEITYDLDSLHATALSGDLRQTAMVRVSNIGVDMNRICRLELLSRQLAAQPGCLTPAALSHELDEIEASPAPYPAWITPWLLGASCGAFCAVIEGSPWQIAAAFTGAFAGHLLRLRHQKTQPHPPVATIVVTCAFASALVSWAAARLLGISAAALGVVSPVAALGPGKAVLASVLYLIPGVPLVQGLIDLMHFDLSAGLARSAFATMVVVCIAVGVLTFLSLTGFALT